ncbi:hypothetical protein BgiMline_012606, partial [Biomphalaria glabrata]
DGRAPPHFSERPSNQLMVEADRDGGHGGQTRGSIMAPDINAPVMFRLHKNVLPKF